ncbi:MAG TPA: hypothetical protein VHC22_04530 [Pirellulales bacterium]|nr:hypothetical protein [Pirellulales bacterium]
MLGRRALPLVFCFVALSGAARAEDAFYRVRLTELKLTDGRFPDQAQYRTDWSYNWRTRQRREAMHLRAVLDGEGEVYVEDESRFRWWSQTPLPGEHIIAVRAPAGREVTGSLYVPKADYNGMVRLRFAIDASTALAGGEEFYLAKEEHYEALLDRDLPGGAWHRHQARLALLARGENPRNNWNSRRSLWSFNRSSDINENFDLFIGGRALRENLQLDRELWVSDEDDEMEEMVDVSSIPGITVAEIDWKPLLGDAKPTLDPLAKCIPADQYAVFFPSLAAAAAVADEISQRGAPLARFASRRSEDERVQPRYERQLCLPFSTIVPLLGPDVVASAALTSSDPYSYFFTGTDVAILLESNQPAALRTLLLDQAAVSAAKDKSAKPVSGQTGGLAWSGFLSPDRRVSCYIAALESAVVVTNSTAQLERLVRVERGDAPSAATLDEYKFFRIRYPRGDEDETAFVFLSDAAIRRWCGPRWRIAASRRLNDAAVMSELQARFLDTLVDGKVEEGPIHTDLELSGVGTLRIEAGGVCSSTQNSLEFQTPIAELPFERVTQSEYEAYSAWRDGYQANWSWAFDPIALRLTVKPSRLATDLSVMPLIWGTRYRWMIDMVRGVELGSTDGDPHQAIYHNILAINREARQAGWARFAAGAVNVDPFDWLGNWVSVFVDDDAEYWKKLTEKLDEENAGDGDLGRVAMDRSPLAFYIDVRDALKLTAFLAGMRALVEQVAPGGSAWESFDHQGEPYVRIGPSERTAGKLPAGVGRPYLYYSFSADGLIIAWNQDVMKRAIDRLLERRRLRQTGQPLAAAGRPWLGTSAGLQFDKRFVDLISVFAGNEAQQASQALSWGNLPILNEWHRRWPDRDPVKLHEQFWHTRLVCPGGGDYVWNDEWQTMESTVYGHPGQPRRGPANVALADVVGGNFGLTFEDHGLRARATIDRRPREGE